MMPNDLQWLRLLMNLVDSLLFAVFASLSARSLVHLLQLESYQVDGFFRTLKKTKGTLWPGTVAFLVYFAIFGCMIVLLGFQNATQYPDTLLPIVPRIGAMICVLMVAILQSRQKAKKPLVYTKRMKRLIATLCMVNALFSVALGMARVGYLAGILLLVQPFVVAFAALCVSPLEKHINKGFFKDAQRLLLAREDLIKIGITGSYGKTSTKFILATILGEKYNVLSTPSSFNTPMGLTRVIREQLNDQHEVFLAEMGARHVGDIKELCTLVHPTIGVITSIGAQHLETFHTIERVASTKFELMDALPIDGTAFFAQQVAGSYKELVASCPVQTKIIAGLTKEADIWATDLQVGAMGSTFTLVLADQSTISMHTQLLGEHNISNIVLCCAVAYHLGLVPQEIANGVAKIMPVEHRLQLLPAAGGNVVIDDAFNANPIGAKAALDVLAAFPGRKVIVTPGMVELGEQEQELNRVFGTQMADAVDVAILVGLKRSEPMVKGLQSKGFPNENLHVVATLDDAVVLLGKIARSGDVTLFENDLPDHYEK